MCSLIVSVLSIRARYNDGSVIRTLTGVEEGSNSHSGMSWFVHFMVQLYRRVVQPSVCGKRASILFPNPSPFQMYVCEVTLHRPTEASSLWICSTAHSSQDRCRSRTFTTKRTNDEEDGSEHLQDQTSLLNED